LLHASIDIRPIARGTFAAVVCIDAPIKFIDEAGVVFARDGWTTKAAEKFEGQRRAGAFRQSQRCGEDFGKACTHDFIIALAPFAATGIASAFVAVPSTG
jgi:hypothetical protein